MITLRDIHLLHQGIITLEVVRKRFDGNKSQITYEYYACEYDIPGSYYETEVEFTHIIDGHLQVVIYV